MTLRLSIPDQPPDWQDRYDGPLAGAHVPARAVFERALAATPGWVRPAMALRRALVAPFGLVTGVGQSDSQAHFLAQLPVAREEDDAFETGLTDRHLTFTLRTTTAPGQVRVETRIWFHAWYGRVYLRLVQPAHMLILRQMMRRLEASA